MNKIGLNVFFLLLVSILIFFITMSFRFFTLPLDMKNKVSLTPDDDYFKSNFLRYEDFVYDENIKTVLLHNTASQLTNPIIPLNSGEILKLTFDDFRIQPRDYYYSFIHCNANWTPSDLKNNEFIDGYFEDIIFDYHYSINTDIPYLNYQLTFPNEHVKFTKSGNYIIKVYEVGKENEPILTKRFMLYESLVSISIDTKRATSVEYQFSKQEVDFKIDHTGYQILDPFRSLNVVVMQNFRWDNAIYNLQPRFIKDNLLDFDYDQENNFDGNNEFREFDLKSIRYQTMNVERIQYNNEKKINDVFLVFDDNRSYKKYYTRPDLNGNFLIKRNEGENSHVEADYVNVHFTLANVMPFADGNLYLFGKFTDWKFKEEFKMNYDSISSSYKNEVLLKQGYYNYVYCLLKDGSKNVGDISAVEGTHMLTENDYSILVYHRLPNQIYDRLIGFHTANTNVK